MRLRQLFAAVYAARYAKQRRLFQRTLDVVMLDRHEHRMAQLRALSWDRTAPETDQWRRLVVDWLDLARYGELRRSPPHG